MESRYFRHHNRPIRRGELMRKDFFFTMMFCFVPFCLMAQNPGARAPFGEDATRASFFGGYSYGRNAGNGFSGWEGQGTFNFTRNLGITADINSASMSPFGFSALGFSASTYQRLTSYLVGPTVTASLGRSSVFGHALFGVAHSSLGGGISVPIIGGISTGITSGTGFAMEFGGGVDIGITRHLAFRAVQVDYLRTQLNTFDAISGGLSTSLDNRQNTFRYSTGIVFRF
jgi:hypothetical protein